jgi:N6-adenosine-specific RNA methylase IME4
MDKYDLIYCDPPWHWKARSNKGEDRSAKNHYNIMSLEDIKALPVSKLANDNSVLLMWAIDPMLDKAFEVIEAWGFTFKTVGFYWVKTNMKSDGFFTGMGYFTRSNPEQCLLATRGKGLPRIDKGVPKLLIYPRREHSEKPIVIHYQIDRLFGDVRRLEMFARRPFVGWDVFGDQVENSIIIE